MTWLDAWLDTDAEVTPDNVHEKLQIATDVGLLIKKTRKVVILAANYETDSNLIRFITQIPTVLVLKIEKALDFETVFEKKGSHDGTNEPESTQSSPSELQRSEK